MLLANEKDQPDGQLSRSFLVVRLLDFLALGLWMVMDTWLFNFNRSATVSILANPSVALWVPVTMQAHAAIRMNGYMFPGLLKSKLARVDINSLPTIKADPNYLANLAKKNTSGNC